MQLVATCYATWFVVQTVPEQVQRNLHTLKCQFGNGVLTPDGRIKMSGGIPNSPPASSIASSSPLDSRPDAEGRIGLAMPEAAAREAAELSESTGSGGVVDYRKVMGGG